MSILDIDNIHNYDMDTVCHIYKMWLEGMNAYRACGFYKGIGEKIITLPEDWENWVLYHCTHLSNYGDFCCVIAPPDFDAEYTVYEPFRTFDKNVPYEYINGYQKTKLYTVKDLLNWYESEIDKQHD